MGGGGGLAPQHFAILYINITKMYAKLRPRTWHENENILDTFRPNYQGYVDNETV